MLIGMQDLSGSIQWNRWSPAAGSRPEIDDSLSGMHQIAYFGRIAFNSEWVK